MILFEYPTMRLKTCDSNWPTSYQDKRELANIIATNQSSHRSTATWTLPKVAIRAIMFSCVSKNPISWSCETWEAYNCSSGSFDLFGSARHTVVKSFIYHFCVWTLFHEEPMLSCVPCELLMLAITIIIYLSKNIK